MFFKLLLCNNTFILELVRLRSDQRLPHGAFTGCEHQSFALRTLVLIFLAPLSPADSRAAQQDVQHRSLEEAAEAVEEHGST